MNVISLRNGTARPEEMLRNARMTGVVKLQRCIKLLSQGQLWAVLVAIVGHVNLTLPEILAPLRAHLCKANSCGVEICQNWSLKTPC